MFPFKKLLIAAGCAGAMVASGVTFANTAVRSQVPAQAPAPAATVAPSWSAETPAAFPSDKIQLDAHDLEQLHQQVDQQVQQQLHQLIPDLSQHGEIKRYVSLFTDPKFMAAVAKIREHPNRKLLLAVEFGWFVVIFLFRAWRGSAITHWARRLLMRFWTGIVLVLGSTLVIPSLLLGEPYLEFLRLLVNGLVGTHF